MWGGELGVGWTNTSKSSNQHFILCSRLSSVYRLSMSDLVSHLLAFSVSVVFFFFAMSADKCVYSQECASLCV